MDCLDANAVQDLMAGALDDAARGVALEHLDGCADCRDLISLLAREATRAAAIASPTSGGARSNAEGVAESIDTLHDAAPEPPSLTATTASEPPRKPVNPLSKTETAAEDPTQPARVTAPDQTGRVLGRYTLAERLGVGAMGVVYRAADFGLNRSVAVKILHRPDSELTDRLVREARSMAQVNHPNVVTVYDVGVTDGITYIAMELVAGGSLRAWQHEKPRSIPELLQAYIAAGRGLAAAHAAGIVHRDFKPDNALVGHDGRVCVTDFGLAAARAGDGGADQPADINLTSSGVVLGTPAYMAPEQFTGGNIDPRTDQFNFCVALYEALYGSRPFRGKSFEELGDNVCDGKLQPPPAKTQVSGALRAIVVRGLAVRPGDRFPTMDHLLAELGRDRARPWRRASLAAAVLTGALALGLGADLVLRDRVSQVSLQSFDDTAVQLSGSFDRLVQTFDINANQMYLQSAMRDAAAHRDNFDFGLGTQAADAENLEKVHSELFSTDWTIWSESVVGTLVVAVADYKGRLLYTNAAPQHWHTDLTKIPWIDALKAGKEKTITLQRTSDERIAKSGLLGEKPAAQLGFFFARALVLNGERSGYLVQAVDAQQLLDHIDLGRKHGDLSARTTLLTIVDPEDVSIGDVPAALVGAAPRDGAVAELRHGGTLYQVKSQPIKYGASVVGHVVMAREAGGVLSGLFPGARTAFAIAMFGALALAVAATWIARRVARGA